MTVDWGQEVRLGEGAVNLALFIGTLKKVGYAGPLAPDPRPARHPRGTVAGHAG